MVTTRQQWLAARSKGVEIQLPDFGDVVSIRPMDVEFFITSGKVPDYLDSTVQKIIAGEEYKMPIPSADRAEEWRMWLNALIQFVMISPKVVANPRGDDEIALDEMSYADKVFIYQFFGRPASVLRRFRDKQIRDVATVDAAKDDGHPAESLSPHPTVGD